MVEPGQSSTIDPSTTTGSNPVHVSAQEPAQQPTSGTGLCLSGGGYRAMIFHIGVLWRLNEAGILAKLNRISSVSGGSITAGVLAMNWSRLNFDADGVAPQSLFESLVVEPLRAMAGTSVDTSSVLVGAALPFVSISDRVTRHYEQLFGKTSLRDLPDQPEFVINATNLESGQLMRFSKAFLADELVGRVDRPDLPLALAVTASSAFPPILSPCEVDLSDQTWIDPPNTDNGEGAEDAELLTGPAFRGKIRLSDGGVYDNLGLEAVWKDCANVFVSDAGQRMRPNEKPALDWAVQTLRVLDVIDNQVRSLRNGQVIDAFKAQTRTGLFIGIRSDLKNYPVADQIPVDPVVTARLAATPTRLTKMDGDLQKQLINWGYAVCDTGLRSHVLEGESRGALPYPELPLIKKS